MFRTVDMHSGNFVHMKRQGLSKPHVTQTCAGCVKRGDTSEFASQPSAEMIDTVHLDNATAMQRISHRGCPFILACVSIQTDLAFLA